MRVRVLVCSASLLVAGCTSRNSPAVSARSRATGVSVGGVTFAPPDTGFIEIRRFTLQGIATTGGGCRFFYSSGPTPPGMKRIETHPVWMNHKTCTALEVTGYRKVWPEPDTTGYSSVSVSTDLDSAAIAALRRKR